MKRNLLVGSLLLAAATFLTDTAGAQDTVRSSGVLARTPSYSSLIAALAATPAATEKVTNRAVTGTDIRVIDANTVIGGENDQPIKAALEQHKDAIAALRAAVGKNIAYTVALAAHKDKPEAKDVIAVDILADGDVLVYFRK